MRKLFLIPATITFITAGLLTSCTHQDRVEDAQEDVQDAKEDLQEAKENLQQVKTEDPYDSYKAATLAQIEANDSAIHEFQLKLAKKDRPRFQKRIDELQAKNNELKKRLADYKKDDASWESFKTEFSHDMDELGQAIKDLFVDNK